MKILVGFLFSLKFRSSRSHLVPTVHLKIKKMISSLVPSSMKMRIEFLLNPEPQKVESAETCSTVSESSGSDSALPKLVCHKCHHHFRTRKDLNRHLKTLHPSADAIWHHCPHSGCAKKFLRRDALVSHLKSRKAMFYQCKPLRLQIQLPANAIS